MFRVGWVWVFFVGFKVLASLVAMFLVGVDFFLANLSRCNVLGVGGGLLQISILLLGCLFLAGVMWVGGAEVFGVGWICLAFLLIFVVICSPKSIVFNKVSFPSIFTNSFHCFLFFESKVKLGLALLSGVAAWVGLGTVGKVGSWLDMLVGGLGALFLDVPFSGLWLVERGWFVELV